MKIDYYYKTGGREFAARMYNKKQHSSAFTLTIDSSNATINCELSVSEAEDIANELLNYVNEVKELARALKGEST